MAAGFLGDVPALAFVCDDVRTSGSPVAHFRTFAGTRASTKNVLRILGWEELDVNGELKVVASRDSSDAVLSTSPARLEH